MAARTPRRSFASPFVITLAAAPGCWMQSSSSPPPATTTTTTTTAPQQQTADHKDPTPPTIVANPPRPQPTDARTNPAPPPPIRVVTNPLPPGQTRWTIYKSDSGCSAEIHFDCPKPATPGAPVHTCNPPPASAYACPPNIADLLASGPVTIIGDGTTCMTEVVMPACPPKVACNPPRPRKVACPK